jgi:drug/metabolite transporter (DMT)-like permease
MLCTNYLFCIAEALYFTGNNSALIPSDHDGMLAFKFGIVNGVLYLAGLVLNQRNVKINGPIMTTTVSRLGLLIPMTGSIIFLGERPTEIKILGMLLAVFAIIFISTSKRKEEVTSNGFMAKAWLIVMLIVSGTAGLVTKVFLHTGNGQWDNQFLLYTFIMAFILCTILLVKSGKKIRPSDMLYGIALGVPNYMSSLFELKALNKIPAFIVFPSVSICTILVVSLFSMVVFKEKITKKQVISILIIMIALVLLNI